MAKKTKAENRAAYLKRKKKETPAQKKSRMLRQKKYAKDVKLGKRKPKKRIKRS